jgi:hypothetical protein
VFILDKILYDDLSVVQSLKSVIFPLNLEAVVDPPRYKFDDGVEFVQLTSLEVLFI